MEKTAPRVYGSACNYITTKIEQFIFWFFGTCEMVFLFFTPQEENCSGDYMIICICRWLEMKQLALYMLDVSMQFVLGQLRWG